MSGSSASWTLPGLLKSLNEGFLGKVEDKANRFEAESGRMQNCDHHCHVIWRELSRLRRVLLVRPTSPNMEEGTKTKKTVFVGGIGDDVDETILLESFSTFGAWLISECQY